MKINERIREKYHTLSASQQKVAHYILENIEEIAVLSAQKIGELSNVSEATVHRLAQALGCNSFIEMKQEIHQFIRTNNRAVNNLMTTTTLQQESWLEQHFLLEAENLIHTSKSLRKEDIFEAAKILLNAKRIWIAGWRMGLTVTSYMQFVLQYMLGNARLIPKGDIAEYTAYFTEDDVVFVCAFPRYCQKTLKTTEIAHTKGTSVIALTDSPLAPVCDYANLQLFAKSKSKSFLDSYTAAVSICNAIVNEIAYIGGERVETNIKRMEDYLSIFN